MNVIRIILALVLLAGMGWQILRNYHVAVELQMCDRATWEAGCEQRRQTIP